MKSAKHSTKEFQEFDAALTRILSISHDELKRREAEWKKQKELKRKKRAANAKVKPR